MLKSTREQRVARHTDWRFLNELKQEAPPLRTRFEPAGHTAFTALCPLDRPGVGGAL